MVTPIRFQRPLLPSVESAAAYFSWAIEKRWFSNWGPCALELEKRLAGRVSDRANVVVTSSATLALMVALRALASPSDRRREVIVPSFTYVASVSAILWSGFTPVFADIDPYHWHLDPSALSDGLSARGDTVAAVLACSTFGTPPPLPVRAAWEKAVAVAGVPLIVDSAAGFGSIDEVGTPLGLQGDAEVFSFHATKPFAVGEGGAVCSQRSDVQDRVRRLCSFGLLAPGELGDEIGLNAKMSEIHAAFGLAMFDQFDAVLETRRRIARSICARLEAMGIALQNGRDGSTWQFVPALAPSAESRDAILGRARADGVEMRRYHEGLHHQPVLRTCPRIGTLDVTDDLARRCLSFPLANDLSESDIERICTVVTS